VETLEDVVRQSIGSHRLYLWLLGVFAVIGTLLAATGIYGVMAYLVTLRTREFGIRMALGADRGRVVRLVVGRGGALVGVGVAIGAGGALALGRFLQALVYGVSTADVVTFGAAAAALAAVGLGACLLPAWRAGRVDPAIALRAD
jgi:putative ABC transport system permease protein